MTPPSPTPPGTVFRQAAAATLGVLAVAVGAYGVYKLRGVLVLVLVALFLAVGVDPTVRWLTARGLPRWTAVTTVVLVGLALVGGFFWLVVPPLVDQGGNLLGDLPGYLQRLSDKSSAVRQVTDRYHLTQRLTDLAGRIPAALGSGAIGYFEQFVGFLASTVTVLALTIYFMADLPRLRRGLAQLSPPRYRDRVVDVVDVVVEKVGGYMMGNIAVSFIAGGATWVCLELLHVPFALPLAVTVGLADLIPLVGATLGAIVCVVVTVATTGIWAAIVVVAFFLGYQAVENYILVPRVLHNAVDLSSMTVLLCALAGGTLLGLVGALMAIPFAAAVKVVFSPRISAMLDASESEAPDTADPGA
ncbi:AI-2E family transporter [Nocardia stercoris]|uniref:AI-2E family transporter n=1 Tax=Nocardia stercoris TaxID=2483361 RepID=A0A3M2LF67_9NOCA|nr:AI-2E family transporter [Nocardia stercoris]RMI33318.1 AI-2E family transporter [Nocardia stercoris]